MNSFLSLPSNLRLLMFVFQSIIAALLVFCAVYNAFGKRHKLFTIYLFSLIISLLVMISCRTPLDKFFNLTAATYLHLIFIVPAGLAIAIAIKDKKWILIVDAIWCISNLPFFFYITYYAYISSALFAYMIVRTIFILMYIFNDIKLNPGYFAIKYALDDSENGIAFVNMFSSITYINNKLRQVLNAIGISSYRTANKIVDKIKAQAEINGRKISDLEYIINVDDSSYCFKFDHPLTQISCVDVSEEERLIKQIEQNKMLIQQTSDKLSSSLKTIEQIQNQKDLLALKGQIHDDLAQKLSILHMFILNDDSTDLTNIKEMLSSIDIATKNEQSLDTIDWLKSMLDSIGVNLDIQGDLPSNKKVHDLFYKLVKEASSNAIKHGKSHQINAIFKESDTSYEAIVSNTGIKHNGEVVFGNGLNSLFTETESLGGSLIVTPSPIFTIKITIDKSTSYSI